MQMQKQNLTLHPGEWHFGNDMESIDTLLGSCVALTVWHPQLRYGGMCHFLLPSAPSPSSIPNPRYGIDSLCLLSCSMETQAPIQEYQFGCFGGAMMFSGNQRIGKSNIHLVQQWLRHQNLLALQTDLGGQHGRKIVLHLDTGKIDVFTLKSIPQEPGESPGELYGN